MEDKDIQKIAEYLYELISNDMQDIKHEIIEEIRGIELATQRTVSNGMNNINSNIGSIEGQMYNLRRV
ncbi:MAG TPA: hypothetical protein GX707_20945 [Epulopiscium sp.]|nr:hypothetical protein [Candidatus Epulonipiscium sp.]